MSLTVGKYTFGAWLRKGIGRSVNEADTLGAGDGVAIERATVPIDVDVNAQGVHKDFAMLGPGDVIGINPQTVVRTEPRDWVTDFEPNYLAFVEFYDEDFIWRYTPARPAGDRLRPWVALILLEDDAPGHPGEFTRDDRRLPLPTISVKSTASLPPHAQTWAWGHVHVNDAFDNTTDFERFLESLHTPDHPNADRVVCRLSSPRHMKANTAYAAFVVPAFETGRLAGLGQDPSAAHAQQPSWTDAPGTVELPVYLQWRFRTGENEDFESLVKKLEPRPVDRRVGIRDMDGEKPGWGLTAGTDIGPLDPPFEKQTVVGLEGALKAPTMKRRPPAVDSSRAFFHQLQDALNFPEQLRSNPATANLPVVSPPIYGEHHALRHTVDTTRGDWLDDLNRDPRWRVPAGFGTSVVQDGQEGYVARAWAQVQKILEANRRIRLVAWALQASRALHANLGARLAPEQKLVFFEPLLRKVRGSATTLQHQLTDSTLPPAAVSGAMRRLVRPRGAVGRRAAAADPAFSHAGLVHGMADGDLTAAPPKPVPSDLATDTGAAGHLPGGQLPDWLRQLLRSRGLLLALLIALLAILLLVALLTDAWGACAAVAAAAIVVFSAAQALGRRFGEAAAIPDPASVTAAVNAAPPREDFRFTETDPVSPPEPVAGSEVTSSQEVTSASADAAHFVQFTSFTPRPGGGDTVEAQDFREAATALNRRLSITVPERVLRRFDLANADAKLSAAVDPLHAFPRLLASGVRFTFDPSWLLEPEHLVPAMAYPDFDDPMYQPLRDCSSELLLPNLELIPQNTLTLLLTNPPFIESYLVGLNCEFGKELLWREYPTDRRGSYFRQFWEVKGILAEAPGESAAEVSERSKDIIPIDTWPSATTMGNHRNPKRPPGEQIVLTVRGEVLKKYPNTLIYAQKAHLAHDRDGNPAPTLEPVIAQVESEADIEREIKFPVFKAGVEPDIRFFGFDLSLAQARGAEHPQFETDDWGYYFIIQQLPGEPRFGMDVTYEPDDTAATPITWDDLAWDLFPGGQQFVATTVKPQGMGFVPAGPGESPDQWGTDAARMASILFQKPVMIAVHAKEMLEGLD
jgi:hypothetical protein